MFASLVALQHPAKAPDPSTRPAASSDALSSRARLLDGYGKLRLSFEQNSGQSDPRVKFLARGQGYTVFLTPQAAVVRLEAPENAKPGDFLKPTRQLAGAETRQAAVLKLALADANQNPDLEALELQPGKSNYLIGNDPSHWKHNISHFSRVKVRSVYPGVDLVYHGNQGQLESDYVVAPGADPRQINLQIEGADAVDLDAQGNLVLSTAVGSVLLHRPRAYQAAPGSSRQQEVAASYLRRGDGLVGIQVGRYDAQQPLVIDPVLAYSTYLGGSTSQGLSGIAVDSAGFAYVAGRTTSADFPVTTGAFQTTFNTHGTGFVTKLSTDGTSLVYSTFLGGTGANGDSANAIAVDALGDAYVVGSASSTDFPITSATAYQTINKGGGGFFTELNPTGSSLVYSTYLSGSAGDRLASIAVDTNGNAYITGATTSSDFPLVTATAFQTTNNASSSQIGTAFLSRIDPTKIGVGSLVYSTFIGGTKQDAGLGVAVDSSANAYITGYTSSPDFPMNSTNTGFQTTLKNLASGNAFVARIDTTQIAALVYSTFLGGSENGMGSNPGDVGTAIALGPSGNAYMTGYTYATDYPTVNPLDTISNIPNQKSVISRIDTTKSGAASLVYSTYFGGTKFNASGTLPGVDLAFAIAVDPAGNIYVGGTSRSIDFPITPGAPQPTIIGIQNASLGKLNPSGSAVLFGTFLGGSIEAVNGLALDTATPANVYVAGSTQGNFPTTPGAFQTAVKITNDSNTNNDAGFIAKLSPGAVTGVFATPANLGFGSVTINTASSPKTVVLTNASASTLTITGATFSGTNAADFSQTTTCTATLAAASSCNYSITFKPTTQSAETATFSIADSDSSSPQTVSLTGTGTPAASVVSLAPATLSFGNQATNTTSAAQIATLTNNGTSTLSGIAITIGGASAAAFAQTTTCTTTLAAGANCTISVTFTPTTTGSATATLSVADSDPSSPQTVALSGTGTTSSPDFSFAVSPQTSSVAAGGMVSITVTVTGLNGFTTPVALSCSGAPVGASCTVPTTVTPTPTGATVTATLLTTARTMVAPPAGSRRLGPRYPTAVWPVAFALILLAAWIARRQPVKKLAWTFALLSIASLTGCSGFPNKGTPAGVYTITITGTAGSLTHQVTVSLTVT